MCISPGSFAGTVLVVDSTLRDGEQAPGIAFSVKEKLQLAEYLADAGVNEIETPIPSGGEDELQINRELIERGFPVLTFCRARIEDLDAASDCGAFRVHISFPVSDRMLKVFGLNEAWLMRAVAEMGALCRERYDFYSAGMLDASRAGDARCAVFAEAVREAGFKRLRYADTLGIQFPRDVTYAIRRLSAAGLPLEYHGHNDLGLATANGLAAVEGGAAAVSSTVLGIGERAGNMAMEEFAMALHFSLSASAGKTSIRLDRLGEICARTAELCGRRIAPDKPVVGSAVFTHESGIHTAALMKDQTAFQPFSPELVGGVSSGVVFGATSGRHALADGFSSLGIAIGEEDLLEFLAWMRRQARQEKKSYELKDLEQLYGKYQQQG